MEPHAPHATRFAGSLLAAGSFATVGVIALFLASGGPELMGETPAGVAQTIADAPTAMTLVGILSVPANLAVIVGALILSRRDTGILPGAWYVVAVGMGLVMSYDLAFPFAIVPLAQSFAQEPIVFEAIFRTFDLMHSIGLLMIFLALASTFAAEANQTLPRWWAYGASGAAVLAAVLAISFLARQPLVFIAPSAFIVWLSLGALGVRLALSATANPATPAAPHSR